MMKSEKEKGTNTLATPGKKQKTISTGARDIKRTKGCSHTAEFDNSDSFGQVFDKCRI